MGQNTVQMNKFNQDNYLNKQNNNNNNNSEIAYISAEVNGIFTKIMIDTGANVSLIDQLELNKIQSRSKETIPTLPINNITLIGATGRQNKTIRKQVQLEVTSQGKTLPIIFLVASGLPFSLLIGCDVLRKYACLLYTS